MFVPRVFWCLCVRTYTPEAHWMVVLFTLVKRNGKQLFSNPRECFYIPSIPVSPLEAFFFPPSLTRLWSTTMCWKTDLFMINIKIRQQKEVWEPILSSDGTFLCLPLLFERDTGACWERWLTAPVFEFWIHLHCELPYIDSPFWFLCCFGNRIEEISVKVWFIWWSIIG